MIHRGYQEGLTMIWFAKKNFQEISEKMWIFFPSLIFFASVFSFKTKYYYDRTGTTFETFLLL